MYYRQKILLSLIEFCGRNLSNTRLEKLLFLYSKKYNQYYDFFPFKYGCFSLQSYHDKRILIKNGFLEDSENSFILKKNISFIDKIKNEDHNDLKIFSLKHKRLTNKELIRKTYIEYPFYASKSIILEDVLDDTEKNVIHNYNEINQKTLFTIGYEGKTIDKYLQILIKNQINTVIDVRKNPFSMKFNFSKNKFSEYLKRVNIKYFHFPELGIHSFLRSNLETPDDYKKLFTIYEREILTKNQIYIYKIYELLKKYNQIVLMCFEKDYHYCHRYKIAECCNSQFNIPIKHL
ncbi:MAG: DUF488 domain-containing protein [Candidatus Cloacimonetes bacterium]|nr:DUF488 domain-containing protein [Candidatus Cloacimonadota bacterium]